ncbi:MAG: ComF family protein [Clostridiales bacterium]|nr:ComF family protein [Candidatus Equinaster intestinalis]
MSLLNDVLNLVYPRRCAACNKVIENEMYLCGDCEKLISYNENLCIKCGGEKGNCRCLKNIYRFKGCVAPIVNDAENTAMKCIYNYKLNDNGEVADFFAALMVNMIRKELGNIKFDAVTSVPSAYGKIERKGYDHSGLLAQKVAKGLKLPYQNMLFKAGNHNQHNMGRAERFKNIRNLFKANARYDYQNVLLIDDLITTGATLDECTRVLMFAGVENVYCAAAVTVGLEKPKENEYNENGEEI